jgi:hypothetical protein
MFVVHILLGILASTTAAILAVSNGHSFWFGAAAYVGVGMMTVVTLAAASALLNGMSRMQKHSSLLPSNMKLSEH